MDIETILKQAEQETVLYNKLQKAAEQLEADNPELAGQVVPMLENLSDEDLDAILAAAGETSEQQEEGAVEEQKVETAAKEDEKAEPVAEEQKAEAADDEKQETEGSTEADTEEETNEETNEEAGEEVGEAKAAEDVTAEEAEMIDKIAEADVLAEYIGTQAIDAMVKRAAEYGITFQTPEAAALETLAAEMGEKIAESMLPAISEKLASAEESEMDEKTAQELYDIGRLACIGRLYLEELQSVGDSDS
jgi:hypothetical protein